MHIWQIILKYFNASSTNNKEFTVGGIIYYFPGEEIWPFSNNISTYTVIASYNAMEYIYPSSKYGYDYVGASTMKSMVDTMFPTKFARTLMYVNTDSKEADAILDSKLLSFANENYYILYNYKESNIKLYQEGFSNSLIIGLLGFTSSAIAFIILYKILVSKVEQV